jgi:hypothetical protein
MKKILSLIAATVAISAFVPADALAGPQQERMKRCSQEAREKTLKGDERKQFMSTCLRGKHDQAAAEAGGGAATSAPPAKEVADKAAEGKAPAAAPRADTSKRKACNQAATEQSLTGAKRKTFMAECMSA